MTSSSRASISRSYDPNLYKDDFVDSGSKTKRNLAKKKLRFSSQVSYSPLHYEDKPSRDLENIFIDKKRIRKQPLTKMSEKTDESCVLTKIKSQKDRANLSCYKCHNVNIDETAFPHTSLPQVRLCQNSPEVEIRQLNKDFTKIKIQTRKKQNNFPTMTVIANDMAKSKICPKSVFYTETAKGKNLIKTKVQENNSKNYNSKSFETYAEQRPQRKSTPRRSKRAETDKTETVNIVPKLKLISDCRDCTLTSTIRTDSMLEPGSERLFKSTAAQTNFCGAPDSTETKKKSPPKVKIKLEPEVFSSSVSSSFTNLTVTPKSPDMFKCKFCSKSFESILSVRRHENVFCIKDWASIVGNQAKT